MTYTDITDKVLEIFRSNSDEIKKEAIVEKFFRQYNVKDPKHVETLDFIIEQIGGINETIKLFNLLLLACSTFQSNVVDILLDKGANPNCVRFGATPLVYLMSKSYDHNMQESELKEKKKKILFSLLCHGMHLTAKGDGYANIAEYAKLRGNLSLLQSIAQHTDVLNGNQKKEWETLKLQMLFC